MYLQQIYDLLSSPKSKYVYIKKIYGQAFLIYLLLLLFIFQSCNNPAQETVVFETNQPKIIEHSSSPFNKIDFFPIGVWVQPANFSGAYKNSGFNMIVGVWGELSEATLNQYKRHGLYVIPTIEQTAPSLRQDTSIIGWISGNEPDHKPPFNFWGWNEPVNPQSIIDYYNNLKIIEPMRPALLILGRDVGYPNNYFYSGRGSRSKYREDYIEYLEGCDIVAFNCYIHSDEDKNIQGKYWLLANGVQNLYKWSDNKKGIWGFVETTKIGRGLTQKPSPRIVKSEVWIQIIHGATGIIYFAHGVIIPNGYLREDALVSDLEMMQELSIINTQIHDLASIIKSSNLENLSEAISENPEVPIAHVMKQDETHYYIFSIAMRPKFTKATFNIKGLKASAQIDVIDENRTITAKAGQFSDIFTPMNVHLYKFRKEDVESN